MSGLGAVLRLDRRQAEPRELGAVLGAQRFRGPDGVHSWVEGPCALGHLHFRTTPEEATEEQPLVASGGRLALAYDGRLDNREEIWRSLPGRLDPLASYSDARLVLAAYGAWGCEAFPRLLGPFAVVLWDGRGGDGGKEGGELILARDGLGGRPLKMFRHRDLVVVASEEVGILAHPAVPRELSRERLAVYFSLAPLSDGKTFFEGVEDLLPGQGLRIGLGGSRSFTCWAPAWKERIRGRRDEELAEEFRSLLRQSVRCRMRSPKAPAVMMSGGLDSTPLAALASRELPVEEPLQTYTWAFEEHPECDERFYVEALGRSVPFESHSVFADDAWPLAGGRAWPVHPATPEQNPYRLFHERTYQAARDGGHRVLLSGMTGDQLYGGTDGWFYDSLREGRWRAAAGELRFHLERRSLRYALQGLLPPGARRRSRRAPWLTKEASTLLGNQNPWPRQARLCRRPLQAQSLLDPMNGHGLAVEALYASRRNVELRYPYRDRRLVELMLRVPSEQLSWRGVQRPILRRALTGVLPDLILDRQTKTSFAPIFFKGLMRKEASRVRDLLDDGDGIWRDFVQPEWVERARAATPIPEVAWVVLWFCLSLEIWHQPSQRHSLSGYPSDPIREECLPPIALSPSPRRSVSQ